MTPFILVLMDFLAIAPIGSSIFLWFKLLFICLMLVAGAGLVILPLGMLKKSWRKAILAWLSLCGFYLLFASVGLMLGKGLRMHAFKELAGRS
ncbi:MAG: hypothetical protein ABGY95_03645 [Rubritalea sp.]|uniref:hypothetical protein n=1 Tax=Rubritalea sp. TaxID=2109375 RepID=UPI003241C018